MQLLVIRHAPAEDRDKFALTGQSDDLRPLTSKGQEKMRKNVKGLKTIVSKISVIAHSPLVRTQQTADILASSYPQARRDILSALAPLGTTSILLAYLQTHAARTQTMAFVGHEPDLGQLVTWLLSGQVDIWMPLKKGSVCSLNFPEQIEKGQAELSWALAPKQLRQLAD